MKLLSARDERETDGQGGRESPANGPFVHVYLRIRSALQTKPVKRFSSTSRPGKTASGRLQPRWRTRTSAKTSR